MLRLSGTARLDDGSRRSFAIDHAATSVVITMQSENGPVGSLIVQFDESGNPYIRLKKESKIRIQISGFRQFKIFEFDKEVM